jgi:uncharacterized protein YecT (DUF1311 family)
MRHRTFLIGLAAVTGSTLLCSGALAACDGNTQMEMTACEAADLQRTETQLTALYAKFKPVPPELRTAERAWIAYRDAECAYEHHASPDGSMYPMEEAMCRTALDRQRIEVLRSDLKEKY